MAGLRNRRPSLDTSGLMQLAETAELAALPITKKEKRIKEPDFSAPSQTVTFIIGKAAEEEKFVVHKEHACQYSPVLNSAFNGSFIEGQTQEYTMDDVTPDTFRLLVHWLYSQKLNVTALGLRNLASFDPKSDESKEIFRSGQKQAKNFVELWVLARRLLIPRLQNLVMDHLVDAKATWPMEILLEVSYIYVNTADNDKLRLFIVQLGAWTIPYTYFRICPHRFTKEFLLDLATVFSAALSASTLDNRRNRINAADFYVNDDIEVDRGQFWYSPLSDDSKIFTNL